jgi:hypothetical protein
MSLGSVPGARDQTNLAATCVLAMGYCLHVFRIDATSDAAQMVDFKPVRNWPHK